MRLHSQAVTSSFQLPQKHGYELAFSKSTPSCTLTTLKNMWEKKETRRRADTMGLEKNPGQDLSGVA